MLKLKCLNLFNLLDRVRFFISFLAVLLPLLFLYHYTCCRLTSKTLFCHPIGTSFSAWISFLQGNLNQTRRLRKGSRNLMSRGFSSQLIGGGRWWRVCLRFWWLLGLDKPWGWKTTGWIFLCLKWWLGRHSGMWTVRANRIDGSGRDYWLSKRKWMHCERKTLLPELFVIGQGVYG